MLRRVAVCGLFMVVASACDSHDKTEAGASVLSWDRSQSERENVKSAKAAGDPTTHNYALEAKMGKGVVKVDLVVETAPLEIAEDGKTTKHTAPTKVAATVTDAGGYLVTASCSGPNYLLPAAGDDGEMVTPEAMMVDCTFKTKQPSADELFMIQPDGTGELNLVGDQVSATKK